MKTNFLKIGIIIVGSVAAMMLTSFTNETEKNTSLKISTVNDENEVYEFVWEHICNPMNEQIKEKGNASIKNFSRCPSGYNDVITTKQDSIKPERFVNGKIEYYRGCSPSYVCDFKVCVTKNFAMLKPKGSTEYISVNEFIKRVNAKNTIQVKSKSVQG